MKIKVIRRLIKFRPAFRFIKGSRNIVLPGFEGLSVYTVTKFFFHGFHNGNLNMRAAALAFSFFLAIFPSIIFLFTLIPYIPIEHFDDYLFNLLQSVMPKAAFEATQDTIADIIRNQRSGLLSFGFFSALYFSTNGFNAMINAFNETYHTLESRKPLYQRLVSLFRVIVMAIMIWAATKLIVASELGLHKLIHTSSVLYYLLLFGKWSILVGLCFCMISFNYYVGPKRKKGWRFFSAGSIFATVFIVIASI